MFPLELENKISTKKGIVCKWFLFYLSLQWVKYTNLKFLRPSIHSCFVVGVFFFFFLFNKYNNLFLWWHYFDLFMCVLRVCVQEKFQNLFQHYQLVPAIWQGAWQILSYTSWTWNVTVYQLKIIQIGSTAWQCSRVFSHNT